MPELQAYLQARYERCKDAVAFLCGNDQSTFNLLLMQWQRDYWRERAEKAEGAAH